MTNKKKPYKKKVKKATRAKKKELAIVPAKNLYKQAIDFAADSFRNGQSEQYVAESLLEANPKFGPENISFILHQGSLQIASEHARDRTSIVSLHVRRYNMEIEKIEKTNWLEHPPLYRRQAEIDGLLSMLEVMFCKEKVLQIHSKETQVKIFNRLNAKIHERKVSFDVSKLSFAEQLELLTLVSKTKKQEELFSVKKGEGMQNIEDAEVIEITNNNVSQIINVNERKPEVEPEPEVTINSVKQKIADALRKRAQEDFERAGAKGGPTVIDMRKKK